MSKERQIFDGITVLDFSQVLAGPTVTRMMVELGAEVIKVELAPEGDLSRGLPYVKGGRSGYFIQQNRGKKSVCVDVKDPDGRAAVMSLVPGADVLVESFSPGTIGRLGFDYATVNSVNPSIIMCSISAFGQQGPLSTKPGYDNIAQAYSGVTSMIGDADGPPAFTAVGLGDVMTGVHGFAAVVSALFHKERTGRGQHVEASLLDSYFHCHEVNVQAISGSNGTVNPSRSGSQHYAVTPFGIFKAKDGYLMLGVVVDREWPRLCEAIGRPALARDIRFATNAGRCERQGEITVMIEQWLATLDSAEDARRLLEAARIPVAPVLSVEEAMAHPHHREHGTVRTVSDRVWGHFDLPGFPLRFSAFPERLPLEAPYLGEHNEEVLAPHLGVEECRRLKGKGVLVEEGVAVTKD